MILNEGGNVFKKVEGEEVIPLTQRIATPDIKPTIEWMNTTFGFTTIEGINRDEPQAFLSE